MYDPTFPQNLYTQIYVDRNTFDNYDTFATYADLPPASNCILDRLYYITDSGVYYRWDGAAFQVAINPASGTVLSVTAGNSSIVIGGTAQNVTVGTSQALTTAASPTFNEVTLSTTTPSANNKAVSKLYTDTKVGSVTAASASVVIAGTSTAPTIDTVQNIQTSASPNFNEVQLTTTTPSTNAMAASKLYTDTKVGSVTAASASVVIAGTSTAPTIDTVQNIQTSASPNFNEVQLTTTTPSTNAMAASKLYVDGLISGTVQTASNLGSGTGVFKSKVGLDLEFKSLTATSNKITLANNTDDVGIDVNQSNLSLTDTQTIDSTNGTYISSGNTLKQDLTSLDGNLLSTLATANSKVATVSTTQSFLLGTSGTTGITLDPMIGSNEGIRYDVTTIAGAGALAFDSLTFASTTFCHFGLTPSNCNLNTRDAVIRRVFQFYDTISLPMRFRICVNSTDYAEFSLSSSSGLGASTYKFNCTFIPGNSTITSIIAGTIVYVIFAKYQPILSAASASIVVNNTNKEAPTIDTVQNIQTSASPTFTGITLTNGTKSAVPSAANDIVNKTYADLSLLKSANLSDVSSAQSSLSNITGIANATKANGALMIGNGTNFTTGTLTRSNGINITNGSGSITIGSDLSLYLAGAVVVPSTGILTLNGVAQTGASPYSITSSVLTIYTDVIIVGSLTVNANSTLIIEGDLICIGGVSLAAGSSLFVRGVIHCRGASSSDLVSIQSSTIVSFDEVSFRGYSGANAGISFGSSSATTSINATSIVFDGNNTQITFANDTAFTLTADSILFNNNTQATANLTILMYKTTIRAAVLKFYNNSNTCTSSSAMYCISLQDLDVVTSNLIEFTNNSITGSLQTGFTVFIGTNTTLSADVITFDTNSQQSGQNAGNCLYFQSTSTLQANRIELLRNYTLNAVALGVRILATCTIKCEQLQVNVITAGGRYESITNSDATQANIQSQYSTGRLPQLFLYNSGATLTNFPLCSYLGYNCFMQIEYEDYAVGTVLTLVTAGTYYQIVPASQAAISNTSLSSQFSLTGTNAEIQYTGENTAYFEVNIDLTGSVSVAGNNYSFTIYKNGSPISSTNRNRYTTSGDPESTDISKIVQLAKNDILSLYVSDLSASARTFTLNYYNMTIKKMQIM